MRRRIFVLWIEAPLPVAVRQDLKAFPSITANLHLEGVMLHVEKHFVDRPIVPSSCNTRSHHLNVSTRPRRRLRWGTCRGLVFFGAIACDRLLCLAHGRGGSRLALLREVIRQRLDRRKVKDQSGGEIHLELPRQRVSELDAGKTVHTSVHERHVVDDVLDAHCLDYLVTHALSHHLGVKSLPLFHCVFHSFRFCRSLCLGVLCRLAQDKRDHLVAVRLSGAISVFSGELEPCLCRLQSLARFVEHVQRLGREDQRDGLPVRVFTFAPKFHRGVRGL